VKQNCRMSSESNGCMFLPWLLLCECGSSHGNNQGVYFKSACNRGMLRKIKNKVEITTLKGYPSGTRNTKRTPAPDSQAVFLRLKKGAFQPVYGRVERRQYNTRKGNMPGAALCALVETRLPATNWFPFNTKNTKEAYHA